MAVIFDTFKEFGQFTINRLKDIGPRVEGGVVHLTKYRITIEEIDSTSEELTARVLELCRECNNVFHKDILRHEARRLGLNRLVIDHELGKYLREGRPPKKKK